jgi:hypothetical protein
MFVPPSAGLMLTLCQRLDLPTSLNSVDKIRVIWREGGSAFCSFDRRDLGYGGLIL